MMKRSTWLLGGVLLAGLVGACGDDGMNNNTNTCGDGTLGGTEQCDDGNTTDGDGCSATCQTESSGQCGDGTIDVATEQCDDGNTTDGDGCSATCQNETVNPCGNGVIDTGEACDDANTASNDGCSSTCVVEAGYVCTGTPSVCALPAGTCAAPFQLMLTDDNGTLVATGTGDTTSSTNQVAEAACDGDVAGGGNDHIWTFTLPDARDVRIELADTTAFDGGIRLLTTPCDVGTEVPEFNGADGCSDFYLVGTAERLGYVKLAAGTYYVVVDGYEATDMGTYTLDVSAAPTTCGDGVVDPLEFCDDNNATAADGCDPKCEVEAGYVCDASEPSVCELACGNGVVDNGEECDDGGTADGDRCSAMCTLEYDVLEAEPNDTTPQALTAGNHIIRGALPAGDLDLYTFTLTVDSTVELETYDTIDASVAYDGVGTLTTVSCLSGSDTVVGIFDNAGDPTDDATAVFGDDEDGAGSCSYLGPNDSADDWIETGIDPNQGTLPAGTYTIAVHNYFSTDAMDRYVLDLKITPSTVPMVPAPGDLVLNEFMAADNVSDTNCDADTTGTADEFVELVNVSMKTLDLTGVTIADSTVVRHTFAAGPTGSMVLSPGKAMVVWSAGAPACPGVTNWFVASTGQLGLNDAGDTITVATGGTTPVTLATYTYANATTNKSSNLSPDVTGTTYANHDTVTGAVGTFSPGKRANATAF